MNWNDVFQYNDGNLLWKEKRRGSKIGAVAGSFANNGYIQVMYDYKQNLAHRIVWQMFNGPIPEGMQIDHINHDRSDNRIENLRLVSNLENHRNKSISKNNTSGFVGVRWHKKHQKWIANIKIKGKLIHLGLFNDIDAAIDARKAANEKYKFHKNHGESNV